MKYFIHQKAKKSQKMAHMVGKNICKLYIW